MTTIVENKNKPKEYPVCDDCLTAAYDLGLETIEEQEFLCKEIGADIKDHLCIVNEEPELNVKCQCACQTSKI